MTLLTTDLRERLLKNGRIRNHYEDAEDPVAALDFLPIVKLFTPDANCTWLLTELDPDEPDIAYGLCDLGLGFPECGSVRLSELESLRGPRGLGVECDRHFVPVKTLTAYAEAARAVGYIKE